jgi:hypothetical protein
MSTPWQARSSEFHPYLVDTLDALPEGLRRAAVAALPPGTAIKRALVSPPEYRSKGLLRSRPIPEQALVFTQDGMLHVQGRLKGADAPPPAFIYPENLLYVRTSHLLLYGRMELVSSVKGQRNDLEMEFNAVGWRMIDVEWRALIGVAIGRPPLAARTDVTESERAALLMQALPAKFSVGLRNYGLYTGEALQETLFQPGVWSRQWGVLNQQRVPNTLLALTDASVILIEEEHALVRKSQQYGWIITRIPLLSIVDVQSQAKDSLEELKFTLTRNGATAERRVLLEPETAQAWLALWAAQRAKG